MQYTDEFCFLLCLLLILGWGGIFLSPPQAHVAKFSTHVIFLSYNRLYMCTGISTGLMHAHSIIRTLELISLPGNKK